MYRTPSVASDWISPDSPNPISVKVELGALSTSNVEEELSNCEGSTIVELGTSTEACGLPD